MILYYGPPRARGAVARAREGASRRRPAVYHFDTNGEGRRATPQKRDGPFEGRYETTTTQPTGYRGADASAGLFYGVKKLPESGAILAGGEHSGSPVRAS